jgi:hypothetical protein
MSSATLTAASTAPSPLRLTCALCASVALHVLLLLMIFFDIAGLGGGFGLGVGPGFGIGAGGGVGLGEKERRQIFSLEDLPELVRPDDTEERLAKLLEPQRRHAITVPRTRAPQRTKGPVVHFSRPVKPQGASVDLSKRFASAGAGIGGLGLGGGGGGAGFSLGFGNYVGSLRKIGLDVAIVIDSTGSMQNIIDEMKQRLGQLVSTMQRLVPSARIGAVAFRDRDDGKTATAPRQSEDFVVRWTGLTFSARKVRGFLDGIVAEGGGDWEEAVKDGLQTAIRQLDWRPDAKKVIILVGSSPPHAEDVASIRSLVSEWRGKGGYVSTIDVSARLHEEHERKLHRWLYGEELSEISSLPDFYEQLQRSFGDIAQAGGGQSIQLGQGGALTRHVLVLAFGDKWQKDMANISRGL